MSQSSRAEPSPKAESRGRNRRKYLWPVGIAFYIAAIRIVGWERLTEAVRGGANG